MKHIRTLGADEYTELERALLEKYNVKLNAHSLHQDEYRLRESTKKQWLYANKYPSTNKSLKGSLALWMVLALIRASVLSLVSWESLRKTTLALMSLSVLVMTGLSAS